MALAERQSVATWRSDWTHQLRLIRLCLNAAASQVPPTVHCLDLPKIWARRVWPYWNCAILPLCRSQSQFVPNKNLDISLWQLWLRLCQRERPRELHFRINAHVSLAGELDWAILPVLCYHVSPQVFLFPWSQTHRQNSNQRHDDLSNSGWVVRTTVIAHVSRRLGL